MSANVDIAVVLRDQYSQRINSMRTANQGWNKSLDEAKGKIEAYNQRLSVLTHQQSQLQTSLAKAKSELKDAEKAFAATADAANAKALEQATEKYNTLRQQVTLTGQAARAAEKDLNGALESIRKADTANQLNVQSGGATSAAAGESGGILSALGQAGAWKMVGDLASDAADYYISSRYGSRAASYASEALSSGAMGAAIGTAIAPGIGTAIGAALGGISGLISGYLDERREKDDEYRSTVKQIYDDVQAEQARALSSGSAIAGTREMTSMSYATLLGGEAEAAALLDRIHSFANITPYTYDELTGSGRSALAYDYSPDEVMSLLSAAGNASAAVGGGTAGLDTIIDVLGRARMGSMDQQQLKRLVQMGINPYTLLANASNDMATNGADMIASGRYSEDQIANIKSMMDYVAEHGPYTAAAIKEMVSKGLIPAEMAAQALADQMDRVYGGALESQSTTFEGLTSTLEGLNADLDVAMGKAYNERRKSDMQEQISFLQGEGGQQMQEAYALIGEFQADLENKQAELERTAIQSVMGGAAIRDQLATAGGATVDELFDELRNGILQGDWQGVSDEYKAKLRNLANDYAEADAKGDGAGMGRAIAAARALAQAEYTHTDEFNQLKESQEQLIGDVQQAVAGSYYTAGWDLSKELERGALEGMASLKANMESELTSAIEGAALRALEVSTALTNGTSILTTAGNFDYGAIHEDGSHAAGLNYVPYDNYLALLHQGERVQTAAEARSEGRSVQIAKMADQIIVREEADIDRLASAFAERIAAASQIYGG